MYPNSDPDLLESMMMQVFINGLKDSTSRKRVILYSPKTLTEAAKYARFSETAVRVAHRAPQAASATVNAIGSSQSSRDRAPRQTGNHQSRRGFHSASGAKPSMGHNNGPPQKKKF